MRFLADMGVAVRVVDRLRACGHDAQHLHEQGLHRLPDEAVFAKAVAEKRILLTFDLDFGEVLAVSQGRLISVIIFRLHNTRTPHVIERLDNVLEHCAKALEEGAVVVVEETRHRVRRLPLRA